MRKEGKSGKQIKRGIKFKTPHEDGKRKKETNKHIRGDRKQWRIDRYENWR